MNLRRLRFWIEPDGKHERDLEQLRERELERMRSRQRDVERRVRRLERLMELKLLRIRKKDI